MTTGNANNEPTGNGSTTYNNQELVLPVSPSIGLDLEELHHWWEKVRGTLVLNDGQIRGAINNHSTEISDLAVAAANLSASIDMVTQRINTLPEPQDIDLEDYVRQEDDRLFARPEVFGAKGDGVTDDYEAIQQCINTYNKCYFYAKTYMVGRKLSVQNGTLLQGAGMDETTIKLIDDCPHATLVPIYYVIGNHNERPTNNVKILDLHIDCNFDGQSAKNATMNAIMLSGANALIERVKVTGSAVGRSRREAFSIFIELYHINVTNFSGSTIRHCVFTNCGRSGNLHEKYDTIITCICTGGNPKSNIFSNGGIVEGCQFIDMTLNQEQRSYLHGVSLMHSRGMKIINNTFVDFYGNCIYHDSWEDYDVLIQGNYGRNVQMGVVFHAVSNQVVMKNVDIVNNRFILAGSATGWYGDVYEQVGVSCYGDGRIENIKIKDNYIEGYKYLNPTTNSWYYPIGIRFINKDGVPSVYKNIWVEGNTIEIPFPSTANPYYLACIWKYDSNYVNSVKFAKNLSLDGQYLYMYLLNPDNSIARKSRVY